MGHVCDLAQDDMLKERMGKDVKKLGDIIQELLRMEPSIPTPKPGHNFSARGNASQHK
ncbi:hypothetical protein F5Y09DRAFT_300932 [Xylaria sp. FL1042]|nr:hypothetical protein F5Y09DRAFT_300932 [Xylaria sp. FL1042]